MLRVRAKSDYEELWRYDLVMSCAGIDESGDVLYLVGNKRVNSDGGCVDKEVKPLAPSNFVVGELLDIDCEAARSVRVLLYVIPYILPDDVVIGRREPFKFIVEITDEGKLICSREFDINCWSGASIDFTIDTLA